MFKKLVKLVMVVLVLIMVLSFTAFAEFVDVSPNTYYFSAVKNLSTIGIINGYEDGTFRPMERVTRAQFMKVVVAAMGKTDEAQILKNATPFLDVDLNHWASGYINLAVKENIVTGYADGTFKPNEEVNYAQAVTFLLRLLGYGTADMTGVWPQNYIEKAKSLKIIQNINIKPSEKVSRADLAVMLDRTLNTTVKGSSQTLAEKSGFGVSKTCIIINSGNIDSSLQDNIVRTDIGDFKAKNFSGLDYLGKKVKLLINSNNEILSIQDIEIDSNPIFIDSIWGNKIMYFDRKGRGTVEIPDNLTIYYQGQKRTFQDIKQNISPGCILALGLSQEQTHLYDYGVLVDPPTSEPIVVKKDITLDDHSIGTIDISNRGGFTIIKNGSKATFSDIKMYDVVYLVKNPHNSSKNFLLVYDNKITGTYDEALPNKNTVNKIKILGKEIEIETSTAASKLNDNPGAFSIGDVITVLTGKNGKIVDVVSPDSTDVSNIAVIINTRKSISTESDTSGKEVYYVKLYKIDGTIVEYQVEEDQSYRKGKVVRFDVKDGIANIMPILYTPIAGRINKDDKMIGDKWLSQNAVILDIHNSYDSGDVKVKKINWQDMPSGELVQDKVIHAETGGAFGDIQLLVLNNFTEAGQYGILIKKVVRDSTASYTLMIDGEQTLFNNINVVFNSLPGDVVYIERDQNGLKHMYTLSPKDGSYEIQAVDSRRIKINNKIYRIADNVIVYDLTGAIPVRITINELSTGKVGYVAIYSGIQPASQDLIKMITIRRFN